MQKMKVSGLLQKVKERKGVERGRKRQRKVCLKPETCLVIIDCAS
jgi:hypothetical protein